VRCLFQKLHTGHCQWFSFTAFQHVDLAIVCDSLFYRNFWAYRVIVAETAKLVIEIAYDV
jgi:hypothetical protein